jgi:alpha-glucosidase (family GH31 glycosyl hydrolase)
MQLPEDEHGFTIDDQAYLGDTGILIHPVTKQAAESVDMYIGESEVFHYRFELTRPTMITMTILFTKARDGTQSLHR